MSLHSDIAEDLPELPSHRAARVGEQAVPEVSAALFDAPPPASTGAEPKPPPEAHLGQLATDPPPQAHAGQSAADPPPQAHAGQLATDPPPQAHAGQLATDPPPQAHAGQSATDPPPTTRRSVGIGLGPLGAVRKHIGAKIVGPYLVLMVLLAFLGTFVVVRQVSSSLEQRFENQLLDAGTAVNQTVLKIEQEQTELIRLMANSEGVAEAIQRNDPAALQLLLVPLQVNSRYSMAEVIDAQGAQILALRPSDGPFARAFDPDAGAWQIAQWILAGRADDFGSKYSQLVDTSFGMVLYTGGPVRGPDSKVVGAVLVGLPVEDLLARLTKDTLANVSLYDTQGSLLTTTLPVGTGSETMRLKAPDYFAGIRQGSVIQRTVSAGGSDYLELVGGLVVRDQVATGMGVALPTGYINQSSARTRLLLSVLFSAVVVAVLFIGLLLASRITAPINILVDACRKVGRGDFEEPVRVHSLDETGILADTFNDMVGGLRERDFIRDTFGRYMGKQVEEQVLSGDLKLGGERKDVTLLMSDIRGFTTLSETMTPEDLVSFLNGYFGIMVSCILEHEGVVDKYMGDAILAVFGAPIPDPRHAEQAALTALDMRRHLAAFNADLATSGHPPIRIGIGINTGPVVAGNIGSEARMEYTVIGDAVNATQRIEDLTKEFKTDILISDTSLALIGGLFETGEPHHVTLRGRSHETAIYPLVRLRAASSDLEVEPVRQAVEEAGSPMGLLAPAAEISVHV